MLRGGLFSRSGTRAPESSAEAGLFRLKATPFRPFGGHKDARLLLSLCEDNRVIHTGLTWGRRGFTMRQPRSGRASARLDSGCSLARLNLQAA